MDKSPASAHTDPSIPMEEVTTSTIYINSKVLTGRLTYTLHRETSENRMKVYYQRKLFNRHNDVLWEVFFKTVSRFKQIPVGIHKMIHNVSPTQQVQCQRRIIQDDICFSCKEGIKSLLHVLTCKTRDLGGKNLSLQETRGALR